MIIKSSSSTTKIYQDITYIIEQPEEKEEEEKATPSQEKTKPKEKGLTGITGATVSNVPYSSLIGGLIVIIIVISGLGIYLFITKKK